MKTAEEKAELLRQQVFSKIRWGARDEEVLDWLQERQGITGSEAEALLTAAHRAKRRAVRTKALVNLVFSSFGILLAAGYVGLQLWGRVFVIGYGSVLIIAIGVASIGVFLRSLLLLLTGRTSGAVD